MPAPPSPAPDLNPLAPLWAAIAAATRLPEPELLPGLLALAGQTPEANAATQALALRLAEGLRSRDSARSGLAQGFVQGLLQEFALNSQEGVALMCLAEALLRVPDAATRDALIRDKIGAGDWQSHLGRSPSLFVNAATWGLLLTGKLVATHSDVGLSAALKRLVGLGGEPLIRRGVDMAMRMMGEQFVSGQTIGQALDNAKPREAQGFRYSYDMLGEAALTEADAQRYLAAYHQAIEAIGQASAGRGIYDGPGISVKLSALHPRYCRAQIERVDAELYPRLLALVRQARRFDIGIHIDAEESERLALSLRLLERLCGEPGLAGWNGIGFVLQAYQKRCPAAVAFAIALARRSGRRLMLRLVKGAYWDSEIKRAQQDGLDGYPVYTRKLHTDVAYLACARKLLAAPDAVYPQFATHNAQTVAAVVHLAGQNFYAGQYEFQCLHGMGEPLYEQVVGAAAQGRLGRPCRVYAPVGSHETLLAYLVRRLLENGANSSFVNRIANPDIALAELVQDPVAAVWALGQSVGQVGAPHPAIALPQALYGRARRNARGLDLASDGQLAEWERALRASAAQEWVARPMLAGERPLAPARPVCNPADARERVGWVHEAGLDDLPLALAADGSAWSATAPADRASVLERAADALEADTLALCALLVREAGKTCANAVGEVREAVDFLRYYAAQVRADFANASHVPLGTVLCISPWNFPLAIFTGQVAAALAAGNRVLAKPAEQTPLIAAQAVQALWAAGVPRAALQLLPGPGQTLGAALVAEPRVQGVLFTGSTEVARLIQRQLSQRLADDGRPLTLVAETGGQNVMLVDSSALAEQVVQDVLASAFDSAGQRCSALRVLCLQEDGADRVLAMLHGALAELQLGNPASLAVDIGPLIDHPAAAAIQAHIAALRGQGRRVTQPRVRDSQDMAQAIAHGSFVAPTLIEIEHLSELRREVFGPVLHVLRFPREGLARLLDDIHASGYGLTLGLHTRIDETIAQVAGQARVGNVYVNRHMVGAVVGVQPFGGEGLSGTGPKAGGPLYLLRLLARRPDAAAARAVAACGSADAPAAPRGLTPDTGLAAQAAADLASLAEWAAAHGHPALAARCPALLADSPSGAARWLAGPTGEANLYRLLPRQAVLCLAEDDEPDAQRLLQLAAVLAVGSQAVWPAQARALVESLPAGLRQRIRLVDDWRSPAVAFDAVLHHGQAESLRQTGIALADRDGPIIAISATNAMDTCPPGQTGIALERLVVERAISLNTAAAGGNASLMSLG